MNNTISTATEFWEDYCHDLERKAADKRFIEMVQSNVKPKDVLKVPKGTSYLELNDLEPRVIWGHRLYALRENVDGDLLLVEVVD